MEAESDRDDDELSPNTQEWAKILLDSIKKATKKNKQNRRKCC